MSHTTRPKLAATIMYNDMVKTSDREISLTPSSDDSSVIGNHLNTIGSNGVHILQSVYINTSCNVLESIIDYAIYHNFAQHSNVTGNAVHTLNASGIFYRGASDYHLIQGNFINNTAGSGMLLGDAFSTSSYISDLTIRGKISSKTPEME
ncbi:MAG: NosD domain-containing protein [Candidatus Thorarchaeota archaeon]